MFARSALLLALVACACSDSGTRSLESDESVESIVEAVVEAVGERDVETVFRHLALDFRGGPVGREPDLDHADAQAIVLEFLLREHPISARLEDLRAGPAEPDGSRRVEARVWFDASDVLRDAAAPIPESASRYRFEVTFARREGTWQAVAASYARIEPPSS
jgi:hypothetical protein